MNFTPVRLQAFVSLNDSESFAHKLNEISHFLGCYLQPLERYLNGKIQNFADENKKIFGYYRYGSFDLFIPQQAGQVLIFPFNGEIDDRLQAIKNNRFAINYNYPNADLFLAGDFAQWEHAPLTENDLIWAKLYENQNK